jgi:hypothetical protein
MRRGAKYAWRERHPASSSSTSRDDEPPASVNRRGMSAVLLPRRRSRLRPGIVAVQIESNRDDRSGGIRVISGSRAACRLRPLKRTPIASVPFVSWNASTFQGHFASAATCTVRQRFPPRGRLSSRGQRGAFDFWWRWFLIFSGGFVNPSECRTTYHEQR